MKEDTREDGPWESGEWSTVAQGKRSDLKDAMDMLNDGASVATVALAYPTTYARYHKGLEKYRQLLLRAIERETPEVTLLYGDPGVGKTRFVRDAEQREDLWAQPIGAAGWFDNYDGQDAVLFDDFDGRMSKTPLRDLLRVLDRYSESVPVKGSYVSWIPKRCYLTTNFHPLEWYDWSTRRRQYGALKRRFTRVIYWRNRVMLTLSPETEAWDTFWETDPLAYQCSCRLASHARGTCPNQ